MQIQYSTSKLHCRSAYTADELLVGTLDEAWYHHQVGAADLGGVGLLVVDSRGARLVG